MGVISGALDPLDEEARHRVLLWIADRFKLEVALKGRKANEGRVARNVGGGHDEAGGAALTDYGDVASAVGAANPTTDLDRVLIVGAWQQSVESQTSLTSQGVNATLKDLGYGVRDMTNTFNRLMAKTPKLAIQLQKSGRSRQSRKQYKITDAGLKRVAALLAGTATSGDDE